MDRRSRPDRRADRLLPRSRRRVRRHLDARGRPVRGACGPHPRRAPRFAPRGRVLELAAGTGQWTGLLAEAADELLVTEASPEMLELNRSQGGGAAERPLRGRGRVRHAGRRTLRRGLLRLLPVPRASGPVRGLLGRPGGPSGARWACLVRRRGRPRAVGRGLDRSRRRHRPAAADRRGGASGDQGHLAARRPRSDGWRSSGGTHRSRRRARSTGATAHRT